MSTPADVHRSTPGYVYGVAIACSGEMKEADPPCSCPCHVASAPYPSNWYCDRCYSGQMRLTTSSVERVTYTHEQAIADGLRDPQPYLVPVPKYWFITKGNTLRDDLNEHFDSGEAAEARAAELNAADAIASLCVPKSHRAAVPRVYACSPKEEK